MKPLKATTILVSGLLVLAASSPASGAAFPIFTTLDIPISLTGEVTHEFDSFGPMLKDRIGIQFDPFTTDLGTVTGMTSTFEAPAGQSYFVDPPSGVSAAMVLQINYLTGGGAGQTEHWPHTIELLNVQGVAPTELSTEAYGRVQGVQVFTQAQYQVNGAFSFTGIALSIDGPFSSAGYQTYTKIQGSLAVGFSSATDTGQFITVIPEPASLSLLAIGGLSLLRRRKR